MKSEEREIRRKRRVLEHAVESERTGKISDSVGGLLLGPSPLSCNIFRVQIVYTLRLDGGESIAHTETSRYSAV